MSKWYKVTLAVPSDAVDAMSYILENTGSKGTSVKDRSDFDLLPNNEGDKVWNLDENNFPKEGAYVTGYFTEDTKISEVTSILHARIEELMEYDILEAKPLIEFEKIKEEDWSTNWQKYYRPIRITRYLEVVPEWKQYNDEAEDGVHSIILDPGLAFGTGQHPTTILSLQALEVAVREGDTVCDVGTGSGVLTIASAHLGAEKVYAYDVDDVAVASAKRNIDANHLSAEVTLASNDLLKDISITADIVVANIVADIILDLLEDAWRVLRKDGIFIVSGIIEDKKDTVLTELKKTGFESIQTLEMKDWYTFIVKKPENE